MQSLSWLHDLGHVFWQVPTSGSEDAPLLLEQPPPATTPRSTVATHNPIAEDFTSDRIDHECGWRSLSRR
jgi:hypothetical protein